MSFITLHWISKKPCDLPGPIFFASDDSTPKGIQDQWKEQAHKDLSLFLKLREKELVSGGELFVTMVGKTPDFAFEISIKQLFEKIYSEGLITTEELENSSVQYYLRKIEDIEAVLLEFKDIFSINHVNVISTPLCGGFGTKESLSLLEKMFWSIHEPSFLSPFEKRNEIEKKEILEKSKKYFGEWLSENYFEKELKANYILVSLTKK